MTERQSARMSKIKNSGLDQYGAEPFERQQFGKAGVEGVKDFSRTRLTRTRTKINITADMQRYCDVLEIR